MLLVFIFMGNSPVLKIVATLFKLIDYKLVLFVLCLIFCNIIVSQITFLKTKALSTGPAATRCREKPCLAPG